MKRFQCPNAECPGDDDAKIERHGFFHRKEDGRRIRRLRCRTCGKTFSTSTKTLEFRQHKRRINNAVRWELTSKVSQRRIALKLGINVKTVARKLLYLGKLGRIHLDNLSLKGLEHVQFDEMQTSEHTKCKPVAIPMLVEAVTQCILGVEVASMPAQHPLREIALSKYGPRADERREAIARLFEDTKRMLAPTAKVTSDRAPHYPPLVAKHLPGRHHEVHRSRRARSIGQGELKRGRRDPLFWFNHTAGMVRDNMSRLVRKTWGNTKRRDRLLAHLHIYAHFHNEVLLPARKRKRFD